MSNSVHIFCILFLKNCVKLRIKFENWHTSRMLTHIWNNGWLSILREGISGVMHYTVIIISCTEMWHFIAALLIEVPFKTFHHISHMNRHVIISIIRRMHVKETKSCANIRIQWDFFQKLFDRPLISCNQPENRNSRVPYNSEQLIY